MAISGTLLKQIIKEEIGKVLKENSHHTKMAVKKLKDNFSYKIVSDLDDDASTEELAKVIHSIEKNYELSLVKMTLLKNIYLMGTGKHLATKVAPRRPSRD